MIWLIGAGNMAIEYAKVLNAQQHSFRVIGRGEESARLFEQKIGQKVIREPLEDVLKNVSEDDTAIVCVSTLASFDVTLCLIELGIKQILVEKPVVLNLKQGEVLQKTIKQYKTGVYVALNRRFYSSVERARQIISQDGGLRSMQFEFTEWAHVIETLDKPEKELAHWVLCNSLHVVDLAFSFSGMPSEIKCFQSGALSWHKPACFSGAGVSMEGVLFSYHADWNSAGRWGLELQTSKRRLYLTPFESLQEQLVGTVAINTVEINDLLDKTFKPGLFKQVKAFLSYEKNGLVNFKDYLSTLPNLLKISGYPKT